MPVPLPNEIVTNIHENAPNLSLKFYKRADVYENRTFKKTLTDKTPFFNEIIKLSSKQEYINAFSVRKNLLEGVGISFEMITTSKLICGMGYEHPLENGFMFDWTTGLPIIPGSSLKGAALRAAEDICDSGPDDEMRLLFDTIVCRDIDIYIHRIFGTKNGAGDIIFFPAYPCLEAGQKFLEIDVMTPHYQPYYSNSDKPNEYPPADWYSPNPIHFLTVPADIKYCFRIANRKNLKDTASHALLTAQKILTHALNECGVGAKTNIFYGYFKDE